MRPERFRRRLYRYGGWRSRLSNPTPVASSGLSKPLAGNRQRMGPLRLAPPRSASEHPAAMSKHRSTASQSHEDDLAL